MTDIIDAYTHYTPPAYLSRLQTSSSEKAREKATRSLEIHEKNPNYLNLQSRIKDLDQDGITTQVTMLQNSLEPNLLGVESDEQMELCRLANNELAGFMNESKGRIVTLGSAPLTVDESDTREEMRRAIRDLGLKGFMVLSNIQGRPIDSFSAFWEEAAALKAAVYIHPTNVQKGVVRKYEDEYDLMHVFGWPFETTLVLSRLAFSGIPEKYPDLAIVSHHMGGMIPFFAGRINESYAKTWLRAEETQVASAGVEKTAIEYFRSFYYDTAVGGSSAALRCGYEIFGSSRIVFSTDYPWGPDAGRERLATYPKLIEDLQISEKEKEDILANNARKILRI